MAPPEPGGPLITKLLRHATRLAAAVVLVVGALGVSQPNAAAQTGDELAWGQYQGGPEHMGARAEGPQPPFRVRWTFPAPAGEALSWPIVAGGWAVAVGSEAVYGVDLASGEEVWSVSRAGGPLSVPAIGDVDGTLVLLYLEGPEGAGPAASPSPADAASPTASPTAVPDEAQGSALVALNLLDQQERWRTPLEGLARSGVTVADSTAYVGDESGKVTAVSLLDGSVVWTAELPGRVDGPIAVGNGGAVAIARDPDAGRVTVLALDAATGEERWQAVPPVSASIGSVSAIADGSVLVGSADRLVRALAIQDGAERWTALVLSFFSTATAPSFAGDSVFVADLSGGLYRLDAASGARRWSYQFNEVIVRSAPVVSGSTVLVGLNDGRLVAVDIDSGHLVWESERTSGLVGTIALGRDVVVAVKGGRDAGLIAFEPDPGGTLVDVASPSELDPGTTLSRYALAAAIVLVGALGPGWLLRRRLGPANLGDVEGETDEGPDDDEDPRGDEEA